MGVWRLKEILLTDFDAKDVMQQSDPVPAAILQKPRTAKGFLLGFGDRSEGIAIISMWKEIRKPLYLLLGFLALMLGAVGVLVPFLPTTPFILLAAWLFARSSRKYHLWLRDNRWFGKTLHAWESGAGMSIREKWRLVILATVFIALSFAVCPNQIGRIALVVVWFIPLSVALFSKTRR